MNAPAQNLKQSKGGLVASVLVLALIGATAAFLGRLERFQKLGQPGVRLVAQELFDDNGKVAATNAVALPHNVPGYSMTNLPIGRVELDWLPKDTTFGRAFYTGTNGFAALVSAVLMGADRTSIHKPEYCLAGQGLHIDSQEIVEIPMQQPMPYRLPVMKMVASRNPKEGEGHELRRALYVFWFVADGQLSADHNSRMLQTAVELISTGVLQRWAYISCFTECLPGGEDAAFAEVQQLLQSMVPLFQTTTGKSSGQGSQVAVAH